MKKKKDIRKILERIKIYLALGSLTFFAFACVAGYYFNEIARVYEEALQANAGQTERTGSVIERILKVCKQEGFNDVDLVIRIASCESGLKRDFLKANKDGSVDRGLFAFNSKYYEKVSNDCAFSVECSTRKFIEEVRNGKVEKWLCYKKIKNL